MAVRCMHEASLHASSWFVTLTYSPEALTSWSLQYRDFQLFMKRLREWRASEEGCRACGPAQAKRGVRFFMCGEYGEGYFRPHFHALLFGIDFPDLKVLKEVSGQTLYSSERLDKIWGNGFASLGAVTMESAQYVARYAQKSLVPGAENKRRNAQHFTLDPETGEVWPQVPEFIRMSLKPGIGAEWFKKYSADVYGRQAEPGLDRVVVNGVAAKPPKYYDVLLGRESEYRLEYVKFVRELDALRRGDSELSPARLMQREAVARARLLLKKRGM